MIKFYYSIIIIFTTTLLFSQTGPAGIETSANNVLWLKADKGTFSNAGTTASTLGGVVQQWNDQSGNAKHATQTIATSKPTWQTNIFNGLPALRFDGSNDGILSAGVTSSGTATFFAVFKISNLSKSNPGILQGSPTGLGYSATPGDKSIGMWVNSSSSKIWGRGIQSDNTQRSLPQGTGLATSTAYIASNRYDGTTINQYVNNAISGTISYNGTLNSWTDIAIGTQGTEAWNGHIAEIIVYKKSLNEAQRNIVDNYLSAKYDIALSSNDKYAGDNAVNGDYDRNVAGVGTETSGSSLTFSASATLGLGIHVLSGLDNGDYILAGHATENNLVNKWDINGLSGTNPARWERVWYIDVTNATAVIKADIEFDMVAGEMSGTTPATAANYKLLYRAGTSGTWSEVATANSVSGNRIIFSSYQFNNNSDDGYYTIGTKNNSVSPLPIELLSFDAQLNNKQVDIKWATATEINNDYFTLEKSNDGIIFESIANVKAAGNSVTYNQYQHIDTNPYDDISYYRLKQTDFDETFTYSKIVTVTNTISKNSINVFPNPNTGSFNISVNGFGNQHLKIVIKDVNGRDYFYKETINSENSNVINIDAEGMLAKGMYIIIVTTNDEIVSRKIIVK